MRRPSATTRVPFYAPERTSTVRAGRCFFGPWKITSPLLVYTAVLTVGALGADSIRAETGSGTVRVGIGCRFFFLITRVTGNPALAACTYSYTTQRLFAPLMIVVAICCVFFDDRLRKTLWAFTLAAVAGLLPYVAYLVLNPGALTKRFNSLSIFHDHAPLSLAAMRFAGRRRNPVVRAQSPLS